MFKRGFIVGLAMIVSAVNYRWGVGAVVLIIGLIQLVISCGYWKQSGARKVLIGCFAVDIVITIITYASNILSGLEIVYILVATILAVVWLGVDITAIKDLKEYIEY